MEDGGYENPNKYHPCNLTFSGSYMEAIGRLSISAKDAY